MASHQTGVNLQCVHLGDSLQTLAFNQFLEWPAGCCTMLYAHDTATILYVTSLYISTDLYRIANCMYNEMASRRIL